MNFEFKTVDGTVSLLNLFGNKTILPTIHIKWQGFR